MGISKKGDQMTISKSIKVFSVLMTMILSSANAGIILSGDQENEPRLDLSKVGIGGNGCAKNTVETAISSDGETIILYHPELSGNLEDSNLLRKSCSVRIPVVVPEGYKVALQAVNFGEGFVERGDTLTVRRELFAVQAPGEVYSKAYNGLRYADISVDEEATSNLVFSGCGMDTTLAMNLSVLLKGNGENSASTGFYMDSTFLKLVIRKCK
jgi:Domain of unknown function (DUF4360)